MQKGDRVQIDLPEDEFFHNMRGTVVSTKDKVRPHRGKFPGTWVKVKCDPEGGIKVSVEIHIRHLISLNVPV